MSKTHVRKGILENNILSVKVMKTEEIQVVKRKEQVPYNGSAANLFSFSLFIIAGSTIFTLF